MKAKHSNPWRSSARGTQTRRCPTGCRHAFMLLFQPALMVGSSQRDVKMFCPSAWQEVPQQAAVLSCHDPAPTKCQFQHVLEGVCIHSLLWKITWVLFRNKNTHMYQVYKNFSMIHFLLVDVSSQSNDKTLLWMKFSPIFPFLSLLFSISHTPTWWSPSFLVN